MIAVRISTPASGGDRRAVSDVHVIRLVKAIREHGEMKLGEALLIVDTVSSGRAVSVAVPDEAAALALVQAVRAAGAEGAVLSGAWIFPGQGSEVAGMGLALAAVDDDAAALLDVASRVTGVDVPRALERGGRALTRTEVLQPVLVAVSLGAARALARRGHAPAIVAGHSLGELSAACWAFELEPQDAIGLAAERGARMAEVAAAQPGGMLAVRDAGEDLAARAAALGLSIANWNSPREVVLAGDREAVARGARELGGAVLRVSGAWHTARFASIVEPLRARFRAALDGRSLRARFVSGTTGAELDEVSIADALADGVAAPVRFVDTVRYVAARADPLVVLAPSRTVRALVRATVGRDRTVLGADDPADLDAFAGGIRSANDPA